MPPMPSVPSASPVPSIPSASSTSFASSASPYLPTGVPAWPTAVAPAQMPYPAVAANANVVSAPHMFVQNGARAERRPRAGLSARNLLIGLAVLILVPLIGAGITYGTAYLNGGISAHAPEKSANVSQIPTAQPTTSSGTPSTGTTGTLPTPTSFVAMSSASQKLIGFLIKYPNGWQEQPASTQSDGSVSVAFAPQQQLGIEMFITRYPAAAGKTSDVNQGQLQSLSSVSGISNLQIVQPQTPQQSIGGEKWDELDATFSNSNGNTFHVVSVTVKHGSYLFNILYASPSTYYDEAIQKYIQPMLDSFKFLS